MTFANITGTTNTTWLPFTATWTANKTSPMLIFGFDSSSGTYIAIDEVSVVDNMNTSVQVLTNPSFESSAASAVGWIPWCASTCAAGSAGNVSSSGCFTGRCYISKCASGGVDYIAQIFPAIIGRTYNITFRYQRVRVSGGATAVSLFAGMV